ncbi:alginate export family protein [Sphingomonas sp. KR3-1]|uniref:alginate export family protein n=1 Tax=Sphingomonas sp. KR3-1 TaxID=3156611 RepID=UPI0032B4286E
MRATLLAPAALLAMVLARPVAAQVVTDEGAPPAPETPPFSIDAGMRIRYEGLAGQARAGIADDDQLLSIRTTLHGEYRTGGFRVGAELSDSRAYLGKAGGAVSANEVDALELVQAYVGLDLPLADKGSARLRLGRIKFDIGARRLLAAHDYRNTASAFTGALATIKAGGATFDLFYVLPQVHLPDDQPSVLENKAAFDRESFDLQLWGGHAAWQWRGTDLELGYFRLRERDRPGEPNRNRDLHTIDARIARAPAPGAPDYEVEGAYQLGVIRADTSPAAAALDVAAWFVHAEIGYTLPGTAGLRVELGYDYVSGDGPARGYGRFDTLYGSRRTDFGPGAIYSAVGRANISSPEVRVEAAPSKRIDAFLSYRPMWSATTADSFSTTGVRDPMGTLGSFAGHQVEGRLRWWLIPSRLQLELDGAWLAKARLLRDAANAPPAGDTRYVALALSIAL